MMRPIRQCLLLGATLGWALAAHAQPRPVVVELFTSQGCSSCPPADAYVGQLSRQSDVIALAFHVDYWDDLGWRDRFALPQSAERQNVYARNLHRSSVYTPQLVVDGQVDSLRDPQAVARALSEHRDGVPVTVTVRAAQVRAPRPFDTIEFGPPSKRSEHDAAAARHVRYPCVVQGKSGF